MGVTRANTFINLIPVFVAILAFIMLNDELGLQKIIGIVIVVAGLFLSQLKKRKKNGKNLAVEIHRK
jgi:drug/metabolite transporter (DMT)-like permease